MDWDELLEIDEFFEQELERPRYGLPPIRTAAYKRARKRRVDYLKKQIEGGTYRMPPSERVAEGILFGRPKWGESLIDKRGRRKDEPREEGEWWKECVG